MLIMVRYTKLFAIGLWQIANHRTQMCSCDLVSSQAAARITIHLASKHKLRAPKDNACGQNTYQIIQHDFFSLQLPFSHRRAVVCCLFFHSQTMSVLSAKATSTTKMNCKHWACKWFDCRRNMKVLHTNLLVTVYTLTGRGHRRRQRKP